MIEEAVDDKNFCLEKINTGHQLKEEPFILLSGRFYMHAWP